MSILKENSAELVSCFLHHPLDLTIPRWKWTIACSNWQMLKRASALTNLACFQQDSSKGEMYTKAGLEKVSTRSHESKASICQKICIICKNHHTHTCTVHLAWPYSPTSTDIPRICTSMSWLMYSPSQYTWPYSLTSMHLPRIWTKIKCLGSCKVRSPFSEKYMKLSSNT